MQQITRRFGLNALTVAVVVTVTAAASSGAASAAQSVKSQSFGRTSQGEAVDIYTLRNANGFQVKISTFGGVITSILAPDAQGKLADVVLGYDSLAAYEVPNGTYFGALVGRYANRIAHGKFTLDGHSYTLPVNNGVNSLHGGPRGFSHVVWTVTPVAKGSSTDGGSLHLAYISRDGEEGYPGTLKAEVRYSLSPAPANELKIEYTATTDKPTVVNLTNHSYFNLNGIAGSSNSNMLDHVVQLHAASYTPVDATLIPLGQLVPVAGTPFDFRTPHPVGERLQAKDEQLQRAGGYDHNFVIDGPPGTLRPAAEVYAPLTGRTLEVLTTQPGVQFYSGNFLDGSAGKAGAHYAKHAGLCLETQHFPDSPNQPNFPSTVLRPGMTYRETTVFRFGHRAASGRSTRP